MNPNTSWFSFQDSFDGYIYVFFQQVTGPKKENINTFTSNKPNFIEKTYNFQCLF